MERRQNNSGRDKFGSTYILAQLSSEPTHLLPHSNSFIDLIFTDQPNLVVNYGTHFSLNSKCLHQITHCKLNLNIEYSPLNERLVRDYKKAHIDTNQ